MLSFKAASFLNFAEKNEFFSSQRRRAPAAVGSAVVSCCGCREGRASSKSSSSSRGLAMESMMKERRGDSASVTDLDPKSTVGGGVEDVYGEDRATEEQLVTPWTVSVASGYSLMRDPHHNKGLAFSEKERDAHYLRGLLPPACITQELQEKKLMNSLRQYQVPLQRYVALMDLQERNERLFYKLLIDNVEELLPVIYTPTVGEACQKYGCIFRRPQGLYISLNRDPGAVPFLWEQSPGQPKHGARLDRPSVAPKLPPVRIFIDKESDNPKFAAEDERERPSNLAECNEEEHKEEEEEDKFSDALETLSRTESFFMNCSVSGMSEMAEKAGASGSFSTDPQVRDFMMGRFLPAAKAAATGSPRASSRRPQVQARKHTKVVSERTGNGEQRLVRFPMNYHHGDNFVQEGEGTSCSYDDEDDEDEEEDCHDTGNFSSKACGLIPKFCLLNPVPGMKLSNRRLPPTSVRRVRGPQIKAMQHGSPVQAEEEYSWEAVYKHKLMHGDPPPPLGEDVSKLTSESNNLSSLSDSLTADGSSPQHRSYIGGISPYRNEPSQSPFQEGKGFLGVPRRDHEGSKTDGSDSFEKYESYWLVMPHHSIKCESGSVSPTVERALHTDAPHIPATPNSKSSSVGTSSDNKDRTRSADEVSEVGVQSQRMDESRGLEPYDRHPLQAKATNIVEPGLTVREETSDWGVIDENNGFKRSDSPSCLKEENGVKKVADPMLPLLPPQLPNLPSESWLSRTLPSVYAKNPSAQSFLGMHCQPRKQASNSFVALHNKGIPVNPLKVQRGHTRFADMLTKPLSPQSEI